MHIGILQCDDVPSSLSDQFCEYSEMFTKNIERNVSDDLQVRFNVYSIPEGTFPHKVDECDAYIITGSRQSLIDGEKLWVSQLLNFVVKLRKAQIKTIGVCFGHQIIAEALGGKVERADSGWLIGAKTANVIAKKSFMKPFQENFIGAVFCEDQVVKLGNDATVLAEMPCCPNAMVLHGANMLSLQSHPEFSSDYAKAVLNLRQDEFPSKRFESGMNSFAKEVLDNDLIFSWFWSFIIADS